MNLLCNLSLGKNVVAVHELRSICKDPICMCLCARARVRACGHTCIVINVWARVWVPVLIYSTAKADTCLFGQLFAIFSCLEIFKVRNVHTDPLELITLVQEGKTFEPLSQEQRGGGGCSSRIISGCIQPLISCFIPSNTSFHPTLHSWQHLIPANT